MKDPHGIIEIDPDVWQPKDPERYEREMKAYREGKSKIVTAEEARKWFKKPESDTPIEVSN